jgi:hypothetical protein
MIRRRTAADIVSIVSTTRTVIPSTAPTAEKLRNMSCDTSSAPTPPAPIMPRTAEARTLISKRNSQNEATIGMIWGRMPHRIPDTSAQPVASTASSGPGVDAFDRLGGPLAEGAHRVQADREGAGPRAQAGDRDEDHCDDELGYGPDGVEQLAHRNPDQRGATLVAARNASGSERTAPMIVPIQAM